jgi:hypothetical protein
MSLSIPRYLSDSHIQDNSIRYAWDDWQHIPAKEQPDAQLAERLRRISQRAVLAVMCGTAEWIVYRFGNLTTETDPWTYLEAAWALTIDARYCGYGSGNWWGEQSSKKWDGPVERPIGEAIIRLETAIQQLYWEGTDPVRRAGLIVSLARYVMTDPAPFNSWLDRVVSRLEVLYPRDPSDQLGDPVPREAVDPNTDFHAEVTERLTDQFLRRLDYRSNAFLSSPEGMLEHFEDDDEDRDFKGTPYVFSLELDRQTRRRRVSQ